MSDYDLALDIDPNNFLGHYNRGLLRAQVGDDNRAIEDFDFVLKMEPDNMIGNFQPWFAACTNGRLPQRYARRLLQSDRRVSQLHGGLLPSCRGPQEDWRPVQGPRRMSSKL